MSRSRSTTTMAGVALGLLLAPAMLSLAEARGGCTLPHALAGPADPAGHFEVLADSGALGGNPAAAMPSRIPISPCVGLRCSGDPVPMPPGTPAPTIEQDETWAELPAPPPALNTTAAPLPIGEPTSLDEQRGHSLFRPPR